MGQSNYIVLENKHFCLKIDKFCVAQSLVYKSNGEECIAVEEKLPLFSLAEERPYNNEIKLAHPNKTTTFHANRVRIEGDKLIVGFELLGWEAVVRLNIKDDYIAFQLEKFNVEFKDFGYLMMDTPPVLRFRLLQLPIASREKFGEWLNVVWDDRVAVNLLATSPYALVDAEKRKNHRILTADAHRDIDLFDCGAALIVTAPDKLLDCIEQVEIDYNLPKGATARKSQELNRSIYWAYAIYPSTVDKHIECAKKGGFSKLIISYNNIFKEEGPYAHCNDFEYRPEYANGDADVKLVIDKLKAAGITPGIHLLHTHIGIKSKYVTPIADYRLNITRHFTLSKPLGLDDTTIYVSQNPRGAVIHPKCRVLKFDGEIIYYEGYSTEPPYCFTGCKRGHFDTNITTHNQGTIGGILDISEYGGSSVYVDQETDLQDEIAEKIAKIYDLGMEIIYFDGSEGTDAPYEFQVPYAQYRVYKKLAKEPLFCEGAAKAHFSWHMISGGNAFDIFKTPVFKESIAKYPLEEAPRMAADFTRINFGWWAFFDDTQADIYEYGTSRAAAWNCPVTVMADVNKITIHPRYDDIFEVLHRWEDVRKLNWLTDEQKEILKKPDIEHTLLINEKGEYELAEYKQMKKAAGGNQNIRAFLFERLGKTYVVLWHLTGEATLRLPICKDKILYEDELGGEKLSIKKDGKKSILSIGKKRYLSTELSKDEVKKAFENAQVID
ncbi:MAG: hypothetical protein WCX81_04425 [Monoglobales bacterium]